MPPAGGMRERRWMVRPLVLSQKDVVNAVFTYASLLKRACMT